MKFLAYILVALLAFSPQPSRAEAQSPMTEPPKTASPADTPARIAEKSVYKVNLPGDFCTGFLHRCGKVITVAHAVRNVEAKLITIQVSSTKAVAVKTRTVDECADLAILELSEPILQPGFKVAAKDPEIGTAFVRWGFPNVYHGAVPFFSSGTLGGINPGDPPIWLVNLPSMGGDSGSPLIDQISGEVLGVSCSKMVSEPPDRFMDMIKEMIATSPPKTQDLATAQTLAFFYNNVGNGLSVAVPRDQLAKFLTDNGIEP